MTDCLKCSYVRGEPKGERVCRKCSRPENVPKGQYVVGPADAGKTLTSLALALEEWEHPGEVGQTIPTIAPALPTTALLTTVGITPGLPAQPADTGGLPAHSRMGGSAAHRFLACSGSTALIAGLKLGESQDDPEWTRHGTLAHELGARCLEQDVDAWELVHEYPLPPEQAAAVQVYIDYVRSLGGRRRVEVKLHLPELHPLMFSTLDAEVLHYVPSDISLEIVDYKHGEGVFVSVDENEQLQYYACMAVFDRPEDFFDDADKVRLTIIQPRISWADPVRSWATTVGELKTWLFDTLLPAMQLRAAELTLVLGDHCRFCPAKLVCPAMSQAFYNFVGVSDDLSGVSNEELGRRYQQVQVVKMRLNALEQEVKRRLLERQDIEGTKLVLGRANRVWKDDAPVVDYWHDNAFVPPVVRSPAQIEALPNGKEFVKEWAYTPEAGLVVALASDPKPAVVPKTNEEKYGDPIKLLDAAG